MNKNDYRIRLGTPADHAEVENLVRESFSVIVFQTESGGAIKPQQMLRKEFSLPSFLMICNCQLTDLQPEMVECKQ